MKIVYNIYTLSGLYFLYFSKSRSFHIVSTRYIHLLPLWYLWYLQTILICSIYSHQLNYFISILLTSAYQPKATRIPPRCTQVLKSPKSIHKMRMSCCRKLLGVHLFQVLNCSIFIGVHVQCQESEWSFICVLGYQFLPLLLRLFY
jgi:hypothetical protein